MFNVESLAELQAINELAGKMKRSARIALRVNPDIDPRTHPHISTGLRENKFGIEFSQSRKAVRRAGNYLRIRIRKA